MPGTVKLRGGPSGPVLTGTPGDALVIAADGASVSSVPFPVPPGGVLPPVTVADNGDQLIVIAGVWAKGLLSYTITSFAHAPTLVLLGSTVTTPSYTAAYSGGPPDLAVLTDTEGTAPKDVTATPGAFSSSASYTKTVFGQSITAHLNAQRAGTSAPQANSTISWGQPSYHGAAVDPGGGGYTQAFIQSLTATGIQLSPNGTYAANDGVGLSEFFCARTAYALAVLSFTVSPGGLPFAVSKVASAVAVTNAAGIIENYDVFRSDNSGLGPFNYAVG